MTCKMQFKNLESKLIKKDRNIKLFLKSNANKILLMLRKNQKKREKK